MFSFLLGVYLEIEFPGLMVIMMNCYTVFHVLCFYTFPQAVFEGSNFSTLLSTLVTVYPFSFSHPNDCEVSYFGFDLQFPYY